MFRATTTTELADQYLGERDVAAAYAAGFRHKVRQLASWVGFDTPAAFTEDALNGFLSSLRLTLRPATVKNYRGDLVVFWRWLADRDLAEHLGHTNLSTFRKFYDARLVAESRPTPPVL